MKADLYIYLRIDNKHYIIHFLEDDNKYVKHYLFIRLNKKFVLIKMVNNKYCVVVNLYIL